jgi:hypothetical protein
VPGGGRSIQDLCQGLKGRGTLLARPDRPLCWFVDVSSNFKISVIEGSRRSTAEMESSNTIDEVMSKIHHQFDILEDQQLLLFAFLRVKLAAPAEPGVSSSSRCSSSSSSQASGGANRQARAHRSTHVR